MARKKVPVDPEDAQPGRGTLYGMDPQAWGATLDAIVDGHGDRTDALRELRAAGFVVPFEETDLRNLTSDEKVRFWLYPDLTVYGGGQYSVEFAPRRFVLVPPVDTPEVPEGETKYHDVARVWVRHLPKDREDDLRRVMGDDVVSVPNPFKRRGLGVPVSPANARRGPDVLPLFPADKVAVLFRMLWFPTAEDKAEMEERNRPYAIWRHFARAVRTYLVAFSDEWVAHHEVD